MQLASAELNLERTRLVLPFDARISTTNVEITQYVQTGTEVGTADGIGAAEIEVQFPQSILQNFFRSTLLDDEVRSIGIGTLSDFIERVNMHAVIRQLTTGSTSAWRGNIVRISDTIDPATRTVGVVVRVENPYANVSSMGRPPLAKGTFVAAELRSDPVSNSIVVPRSALNDGAIRIADENNRLQSRVVQIAFTQGELAILAQGVKAGEQIVVSDLLYATDGMLLETTKDTALAQRIRNEAMSEEILP